MRLFQYRQILIIILSFTLLGCASGISQQARSQVTYSGSFKEIQAQPSHYKGDILLAGGRILQTEASSKHSELIVLQLELDKRNRPIYDSPSAGRFLIQSDQFLDPAIYKKGALLTVVGRIIGGETRLIGQYKYTHPMIDAIEIKLWSTRRQPSATWRFSFGVQTTF
jgi:outer membrane lipoprotein